MRGLVGFDYRVTFDWPKEQAAVCYACLFNSSSVRRPVAKELATATTEEYKASLMICNTAFSVTRVAGPEKAIRSFACVDALSFMGR